MSAPEKGEGSDDVTGRSAASAVLSRAGNPSAAACDSGLGVSSTALLGASGPRGAFSFGGGSQAAVV